MSSPVKQTLLLAFVLIISSTSKASVVKICLKPTADTIFAGKVLTHASLITNTHKKYTMLIYARHTYSSIMLLDVDIRTNESQTTVVQKLYNGKYTNVDSVIVNNKTLMPVESYSDINTSKDSFVYNKNRISGTMLAKEGSKAGTPTKVDTTFSKPMYNGLIYAETYQALSYQKNHPFYLAEYVPGHNVKITRVEYVRDEEINVSAVKIPAKVLEIKTGNIVEHVWLNVKNQEVLKIEAKFPGFDYTLSRLL